MADINGIAHIQLTVIDTDSYAPGYYSILFEDPDGIRIEINHVPSRGLLTE